MRIKLEIPLNSAEIARACNGKTSIEREIRYVTTNSKELMAGDLFVALKGNNFDGEKFVDEAITKGAIPFSTNSLSGGITIDDTAKGLLRLAEYYKTRLKNLKYTVAITGSVGKTTTKEFLHAILSSRYKTHKTEKNNNNRIGLSLSVLSAPHDTEVLVLELGMNHSGEIEEMSIATAPDLAVITNIGSAHIGILGSREAIARAKLEITKGQKQQNVIIPYDEPLLSSLKKCVSFSISNLNADYCLTKESDGSITINKDGKEISKINFDHTDPANLRCLITAIATAYEIGLSVDEIIRGVFAISNINIRQSLFSINEICFLEDCYNASPESMLTAIQSFKSINSYKRKSLLLGDILELGDFTEEIHRQIGAVISPQDFHNLYLFGEHVKFIMDSAVERGFPKERIFQNFTHNHAISAKQIISNADSEDIILLKGSRRMELERIPEIISELTNS